MTFWFGHPLTKKHAKALTRNSSILSFFHPRNLQKYRDAARTFWSDARCARKRLLRGEEIRELTVEMADEEIVFKADKPCHYCGFYSADKVWGLDLEDNTLSYTHANTVLCCFPCNRGKNDGSVETFIDRCERIAIHTSQIWDDGTTLPLAPDVAREPRYVYLARRAATKFPGVECISVSWWCRDPAFTVERRRVKRLVGATPTLASPRKILFPVARAATT